MTCKFAEHEFQKSLNGTLLPGERSWLDAHLLSCAACRRTWEEQRLLARAVGRWVRPLPEDDPGDIFTAQVLARLASRPSPVPRRTLVWLPLTATVLLLALLTELPGLLWPGLDSLGTAARQMPGWLLTNLHGVPADAYAVRGALTVGVPVSSWVWAALLTLTLVNGMFCVQARQSQAQRSLP